MDLGFKHSVNEGLVKIKRLVWKHFVDVVNP